MNVRFWPAITRRESPPAPLRRPPASAARLKGLAAMPTELQERATHAARLFHLDTRGWFRAGDRVPHLPAIASALWRGCRLRIRYREGRATVQRTVDPLGLVLKGGAW